LNERMAHDIRVDLQQEYLTIEICGKANIEQVNAVILDFVKSSEQASIKKLLFDCRQVLIQHLTANDIREVAALIKAKTDSFQNQKWAVVMRNKTDFGMARMWQLLTENHVTFTSKIFQSYEQAKEWLLSSNCDNADSVIPGQKV